MRKWVGRSVIPGWLIADDEKIDVIDTKRENNLPVHLVAKLPKDVTATFTAKINVKKRIQCECNHSATHLLHEALREVLGTHVEQKGSYVSPDSLRFDFSHFQKVTDEEIRKVEILVGEKIRANFPLEEHRNMPIAEAKALGAMALFGEKVWRRGTCREIRKLRGAMWWYAYPGNRYGIRFFARDRRELYRRRCPSYRGGYRPRGRRSNSYMPSKI